MEIRVDCRIFGRQFPEEGRECEGHHLCQQQDHQKSDLIQSQRGSDGDRLVDDGIDAVDVQEEGKQEEQDLMVMADQFAERLPEPGKALCDDGSLRLDIMLLMIEPKERCRDAEPPQGDQDEVDRDRGAQRDHSLRTQQIQNQCDDEGDAGADVAPGKSIGGDDVHADGFGHIDKHRIVQDQGGLVRNLRYDIDDQVDHPACRDREGQDPYKSEECAADHTDQEGSGKEWLLISPVLCQSVEPDGDQR